MAWKIIRGVLGIVVATGLYSWASIILGFSQTRGGVGTVAIISRNYFDTIRDQYHVLVGEITILDMIQTSEKKTGCENPPSAVSGKIFDETSGRISKNDDAFIVGEEKGYALAIGLNAVDPDHYAGWRGDLNGCEPDAANMADIATAQGLNAEKMLTAFATRDAVIKKLDDLARVLKSGDLLVVSYSGHGGQIPDQNGDEADGLDETWCLYDGEFLDDELYQAWSKFKDGVRILVFSDSCHSGTMLKMIREDYEAPTQIRNEELTRRFDDVRSRGILRKEGIRSAMSRDTTYRAKIREVSPAVRAKPQTVEVTDAEIDSAIKHTAFRAVPPQILRRTYEQNRLFYDELGRRVPGEKTATVEASVILISGCADDQPSMDLGTNGLFTLMVKQVWNGGSFNGSHITFHVAIKNKVLEMNQNQSPSFYMIGVGNDRFIQQRPYTIFND